MTRIATAILALIILVALCPYVGADDKAASKPSGAFERTVGDHTLTFDFQAHSFKTTIKSNDGSIEVEADYGVTKTGTLFGIVTKVDKKGTTDGPSEGELFSFQVIIDKDTLTIKELKGASVNDDARQAVEGEYKKKESKKEDK
jgi:hypothetical protein